MLPGHAWEITDMNMEHVQLSPSEAPPRDNIKPRTPQGQPAGPKRPSHSVAYNPGGPYLTPRTAEATI